MTVYERYCRIRDSKGLKDANVADLAKIGQSTFSDWKNGRSAPKEQKLKKIAVALDVSYEYLITGLQNAHDPTIEEAEFYLADPMIKRLVLCAGGIAPSANRDKFLKAVIFTLEAMKEEQNEKGKD